MRRCLQQGRGELVAAWAVAAVGLVVGLLTMDRSASWWDCGEFITTSHGLQVGHPPGAPTYQLLAHFFTLFAFGNPMWVASLSNLLSVLCTALTSMLVCRTVGLMVEGHGRVLAGVVGGLCYLLCDTVWFSAVESEVYAAAMLFASLEVYVALRWEKMGGAWRIVLIGLLAGLGVGVHLLTLLALPAVAVVWLRNLKAASHLKPLVPAVFFFALGLSTYAIIPIRASAHPPINEGDPSTAEAFEAYLRREQYGSSPHLYPRMWRAEDANNAAYWSGDRTDWLGNLRYYATYQLGYMYGRYLMYNFVGRENLKHHIVFPFLLPFLFGLIGMWHQLRRQRRGFWPVLLLFLMGGPLLNLYLNHPCYEPRERDYAYILSFYAFALWIGVGVAVFVRRVAQRRRWVACGVVALAPLLLAVGNWSDHDRHNCHSVHDIALNHLQSCDPDALLFTLGDNDTFPLWYLQQVEHRRTDVSIYNINLTGYMGCREVLLNNEGERPVYLSHYAYQALAPYFGRHFRCEGFCYRRVGSQAEADDPEPLRRHIADSVRWHITPSEYTDQVSASFLRIWRNNVARQLPDNNLQ